MLHSEFFEDGHDGYYQLLGGPKEGRLGERFFELQRLCPNREVPFPMQESEVSEHLTPVAKDDESLGMAFLSFL
jgi:hypothetical protein